MPETYTPRSDNSYYQSYGGWPGFMRSFGLKTWDLDDVEEGKRILEGFKESDRREWKEQQKEARAAQSTNSKTGRK